MYLLLFITKNILFNFMWHSLGQREVVIIREYLSAHTCMLVWLMSDTCDHAVWFSVLVR